MPRTAEDLLTALDPEQREVATTFGVPVVVLAGAGTGKTRAITHRIAYGAETGAYDPRAVLAVTFTTRAAGEMRGRLRALGQPSVQARTFHSAALRQAQFFWPQSYGSPLPRIIDNRMELAFGVLNQLGLRADTTVVRDLLGEISWAKVTNVAPGEYPRRAEAEGRTVPGHDPAQVGRILARYEEVKSDRGVIDLDDILLCAVALLADREDIAEQVRRTYRHLVVDEFQDVSPVQQRLLSLWLGASEDLCVVGDPAQTIHSFAGARSSYLTSFAAEHRRAVTVRLVRDYRSTPEVVGLANKVLRAGRGSLAPLELVAQQPSGPDPVHAGFASEAEEADGVARWLAARHAEGTPYPDLAVLYRIHAQSPHLEAALANAGIPFTIRGAEGFFDRAEVRQALVALRAAQAAATTEPLGRQCRGVLAGLGWTDEPPAGQGRSRERWESWAALAQLAEDTAATDPEATLVQFVTELDARARTEHAPPGGGVTLSTLHAAKGLEWEGVAIVGLVEGTLPFVLAQSPEQLAEERRLFYVGLTRAKRHLHLSWARTRNGGGQSRTPTRFLDGLRPESVAAPAATTRRGDRRRRSALAATCRVCRRPLTNGAERKLRRHRDCPAGYDERTWQLLTEWRKQEAAEAKVPAFVVFTDATLMAIAEQRPADEAGLMKVPGVGRVKCERYAEAILQILALEADQASNPGR